MKKKNYNWLYWIAQLCGWLVLFALTTFVNYQANSLTTNAFFEIVSLISFGFLVSHCFRIILIKKKTFQKALKDQWPIVILLVICGSITVALGQAFVSFVFNETSFKQEFRLALLVVYFINWAVIYLIWLMLYLFYQLLEKQRFKLIEELKLKALQHEIELNNLRSQLNPHFMFNSMNSIRALIDENPDSAKTAITKLAGILRNSLLFSKRNFITLRDEIELVKDYLFLEKIRFEERLEFAFNVPENILDINFPPLMLQTIVENAIKHGISKLPNGGSVNITAFNENDYFHVKVINSGKLISNEKTITGIGINNTIKRLQLLYGNNAKLELKQIDEKVQCYITIPKKMNK